VTLFSAADDLCRYDEALCNSLVQIVCKSVGRELLVRFIVCFLLDSNQASVRWQAHALVLHIYRCLTSLRSLRPFFNPYPALLPLLLSFLSGVLTALGNSMY
jgi:hypothetical protein